jgi:hypothetical protein
MSYDAISTGRQEKHLVFEGVAVEWPTMTEDHWLTSAPVLVVDLSPVPGGDRRHCVSCLELIAESAMEIGAAGKRSRAMDG